MEQSLPFTCASSWKTLVQHVYAVMRRVATDKPSQLPLVIQSLMILLTYLFMLTNCNLMNLHPPRPRKQSRISSKRRLSCGAMSHASSTAALYIRFMIYPLS